MSDNEKNAAEGLPAEERPGAPEVEPEAVPAEDLQALRQRAKERDEFLNLLQRTQAEYLNYRKRTEREMSRLSAEAVGRFVLTLLPAVDDFDRALSHVDQTPDLESFARGIQLIENKLYDLLKANGVEPIDPEGERFDPSQHEAVHVEMTDRVEDGTVASVLRKGFRLGERVLRPAQVVVAKRPTVDDDAPADEE